MNSSSDFKVSLNLKSNNKKTGPIPVSRTERTSCPKTCPFYEKGCYAKYGPESRWWKEVPSSKKSYSWKEFCQQVSDLPNNQLWRHNSAGDLPHKDGVINYLMLKELIAANKNKRGFTYTHHNINITENHVAIETANMMGFTINVSTESVDRADKIMSDENHPLPAVAVINSSCDKRFFKTSSGRKVVVCPATIHENVNCSTCELCSRSNRDFIIAFPAHGVAKKTVNEIVSS